MKQYLVMLAMLVLMISSANAISYQWVYQENSTTQTCSSGGNAQWDGSHACALAYDADWGTYALAATGNSSTVAMNYTKPTYAHNAVWEAKADSGAENITIPVACYSQTPIQLRVVGTDSATSWGCYNGSAWIAPDAGVGAGNGKIYEEAIYWNETVLQNGACGTGLNACTVGTFSDLADSSTEYLWECNGFGGGTDDSCSLPKVEYVFTDLGTGVAGFFDNVGPGLAVFIAIIGIILAIVAMLASFTDISKGLF